MSRLTVYEEKAPGAPVFDSTDPAAVAAELARIDVGFERWDSPVALPPDAPAEAILEAYRPYLDALMGATGAGSADVVKLSPDHPRAAALREQFLSEHTHSEPEIRFFVAGSGHFVLHAEGRVYDTLCERGDLIHVPAGLKHWFDAGPAPSFTALRVFTDPSGWVAQFTGDDISSRFPVT
ncbi:acireductone dioxygenase [Acidocella sp.]|uniref:1,2-dihydroxy-3-keto-5-methylthiopentene dioxygenase n=1 Tax=Acidocella sp. TaxID=50710 RepID=UPI002627E850|nr:cupin domain-containing protein [Acidocella sp.]